MTLPPGYILDEEREEETKVEPSSKAKKVARGLKVFGWTPEAETVEKIRKPLMRKVAYPLTELLTSGLGAPGDVLSLANALIAKPVTEKITGMEGKPYEETLLGKIIPTSEQLHKGIETLTGEKIRPESIGEKLLGTTAGFLGSMFTLSPEGLLKPGTLRYTKIKIPSGVKAVLSAFAPAAAFVGAEEADLPPYAVAGAAIGTSLLMHGATSKSLKQINQDLYKLSGQLAENVMIPSEGLESRLNKLQETMQKGLTTGPKGRINSLIREMEAKISGGAIPLENLIQFRKDIIEAGKEFTYEQLKGSERFWKPLRTAVDETISEYKDPQFQQAFRQANSLYRGRQESQRMGNFIKKHFKESALGLAGSHLLTILKGMMGITPEAALAGVKSYNFIRSMIRNPGFRKAYKDVLKNAANENVKGTTRALKNFNKAAEKEDLEETARLPQGFILD